MGEDPQREELGVRLAGERRLLSARTTEHFKHGAQISGVAEKGGRRRRKQAGEKITGVQGTTKRRREEKKKIMQGLKGQKSQLQKDYLKDIKPMSSYSII